jgi:hypothetical protein
MPRTYRPKPFNPKPFTPGAAITWEHRTTDNRIVVRTGIVWSGAPSLAGWGGRGVWVTPDEPLPGDTYRAIYVYVPPQYRDRVPQKPYSADHVDHNPLADSPGKRTWYAADAARSVRAHNAALAS